jgi:hypothetical protein
MSCCGAQDLSNSGGALVTTAALLSLAIAKGRSVEQITLLALFFTALADNLALYADQLPETGGEDESGALALDAGTSGTET